MTEIKKIIRKGEKPLQQLARRYTEIEKNNEQKMKTPEMLYSVSKIHLKEHHYHRPLTKETLSNVDQFKIFKNEAFTINCNNSKDTCILLKDGNFAVIENIIKKQNDKICFIERKYFRTDNLYENPDSSLFNINIVYSVKLHKELFEIHDIYTKVWKVPCEKGLIVLPLSHKH